MANGVKFTASGAEKIQRVVQKVLGTPDRRVPPRNPTRRLGDEFWAMLMGPADQMGLRYYFVHVVPDASGDQADFAIGKDAAVSYRIASDEPELGYARESNGVRGVDLYTVVKVSCIGLDQDGLPAFLFTFGPPIDDSFLRPHDHRDNFNGGFAFACYHPGTGLPQQPWRV
jgi:hypothetical protein